ncbi:hypothetical protein ACFL2Q_02585 [Thermodesulfobacteriota bacterium]
MFETLTLYSVAWGKKLTLIHDFQSFGLDWMGDLQLQMRYTVASIEELSRCCEDALGVGIRDLRVRHPLPWPLPSVNDGATKIAQYRRGWKRLELDYERGNLRLPVLILED